LEALGVAGVWPAAGFAWDCAGAAETAGLAAEAAEQAQGVELLVTGLFVSLIVD
jgi:hypothetical protein